MLKITPSENVSSVAALLASRDLFRLGVSEVPDGWALSSVGQACEIRNDLRHPISVEDRAKMQGEFPYYGPTGVLDFLNEFRAEGEFALIGEDGDHFLDPLNKSQTVRISGRFNVNNHAHLIFGTDLCEVDWFSYFFLHRDIYHSLTRQGANRFKLTKAALHKLPILLPPLSEQRGIAEILRTWDIATEKLNALRLAKEKRFDGIAASLIHNPQTEQLYLRDILVEVSERNKESSVKRILSVTNSTGFVLASDQFAHRVASADISNYKVVRRGQYAYNPSRINVGSIARLDGWDEGALSPMYVVFQTRSEISSDYFGHWLDTGEARQRIALSAQGSVRETVGFGDLGSVPIPVPSLEKQAAISAALNTGREELVYIQSEIDALQRQKRGLMQKLLTGEWRVSPEKATEAAK